jgi:hypothetical protein
MLSKSPGRSTDVPTHSRDDVRSGSPTRELEPRRCEHCDGDPAGVVVVKRVLTVTYERHRADCPMIAELTR